MYEPYWGLDRKPFGRNCDAPFYFPAEPHQATLLKLRYAVESRAGAALLAGVSGVGKTLVASTLLAQLPAEFGPTAQLVFPHMSPEQLLAWLAAELTGETGEPNEGVDRSLRKLSTRLAETADEGRHAVVLLDEAHLLAGAGALEVVRLLLNLQSHGKGLLTILLVGQTALLPALERMPALDDRLAVKCLLRPLQIEETVSYVNHRLRAAGGEREIFTSDALESIHALTGGAPRQIDRLCDLALLIAYAEEQPQIGAYQIESVANELVAPA